jgi:hypothetical protein
VEVTAGVSFLVDDGAEETEWALQRAEFERFFERLRAATPAWLLTTLPDPEDWTERAFAGAVKDRAKRARRARERTERRLVGAIGDVKRRKRVEGQRMANESRRQAQCWLYLYTRPNLKRQVTPPSNVCVYGLPSKIPTKILKNYRTSYKTIALLATNQPQKYGAAWDKREWLW